jgi:hypothetical protein
MTDDDKPRATPNRRARLWVQDLRGAPARKPDKTAGAVDEGEPWVRGAPTVVQRVPGIDEAQDTTYVEGARKRRSWYVPVLLGVAIGLIVTAVFAAVVVSADSSGSPKQAEVGSAVTASSSTTSTSISTTTTTTATTTTAPLGAATPTTTAPPKLAAAVVPPTPRATSNPAAPPFVTVPLPAGIGSTLTRCTWQPTNGGRYEAAGTMTNGSTNHAWTLTIHWLQNGREIGQQSTLVGLTAGQSLPWSLTLGAPNPPADPFSCALTAA